MTRRYPFSAVAGQAQAKRALLLACLNSAVGGVLLVGERGCAKSVLAQSVEALFPRKPFRTVPLSAVPENLTGAVSAQSLVREGRVVRERGLLEAARGGVLLADEINLFPDGLAELLLQAAGNEASRTTLIGTMDPQEGALRPQLLERFGLCVQMRGEPDRAQRMEVLRRRIAFERGDEAFFRRFDAEDDALRRRLDSAARRLPQVEIPPDTLHMAAELAETALCPGNRTEILLLETARAAAALDGLDSVTRSCLREAAALVLPHRMARESMPLPPGEPEGGDTAPEGEDEPTPETPEMDTESIQPPREGAEASDGDAEEAPEALPEALSALRLDAERGARRSASGAGKRSRTKQDARSGSMIRSEAKPEGELAVSDTLRTAALHRAGRQPPPGMALELRKEDLRRQIKAGRTGASILFVVDASGSMGARMRIRAAKAAVLSLLQDAYEKRDKVGIVAFRGRDARVLLPLTRSIDLARRRLARILTGGTTPLAAGLELAWRVLQEEQRREKDALQYLILLTDGRANVGDRASSPEEAALRMASLIGRSGIRCMVLDTESKYLSVGLAQELAARMNAGYESLPNLSGAQVRSRTAEFVRRNK